MVEVFRTDVGEAGFARYLEEILCQYFPGWRINFDLLDRDKILRMEGDGLIGEVVTRILGEYGFLCEPLE